MNCPKCGKNVRYIATNKDDVICCDDVEYQFFSVNGYKHTGFLPHICEGINGKEQKDTGRNRNIEENQDR